MSDLCRNDEWNSDPPLEEERQDDGPAGIDPNGVIDSNWEEVEGRGVVFILLSYFSIKVCENFDDMNLRDDLLRGIYAFGFEKPSAIQQRAIVHFYIRLFRGRIEHKISKYCRFH